MKDQTNIQNIFQDIFTTEDVYSNYKEIDQCITLLFQFGTTIDQAFNGSMSAQKKDAIMNYLDGKKIDKANPAHIQEALLEIKKEAEKFPVVTLKLGYDPTREHLSTFSNWFLTRIKKKTIFEIIVERSLLGGAYITHNGLFKDYSLKSKLNSVFVKKDFTKNMKS